MAHILEQRQIEKEPKGEKVAEASKSSVSSSPSSELARVSSCASNRLSEPPVSSAILETEAPTYPAILSKQIFMRE